MSRWAVPVISTRGEKTRLIFIIRGWCELLQLSEVVNLEGIRRRWMLSPLFRNCRRYYIWAWPHYTQTTWKLWNINKDLNVQRSYIQRSKKIFLKQRRFLENKKYIIAKEQTFDNQINVTKTCIPKKHPTQISKSITF